MGETRPTWEPQVPAGHGTAAGALLAAQYSPTPHMAALTYCVADVDPAAQKLPTAHTAQPDTLLTPMAALNVPAGQGIAAGESAGSQ